MRLIASDPEDVSSLKRLLRLAAAVLAVIWATGDIAFSQEVPTEKRCEGDGNTRILVRVLELRSSSGLVTVELFDDNPKGFIKKLGRLERIRVNAANGEAKACFLIGSIRSADELPRPAPILRLLARLVPNWATGLPGGCTRVVLAVAGRFMRPNTRSVFRQFAAADGRFMRWAALAIAK